VTTATEAQRDAIPTSLRMLLFELVDYAGLFPPAALDMERAVRNFGGYLAGTDAWALARFVVPVSRFGEFEKAQAAFTEIPQPWRLSALVSADAAADAAAIVEFNDRNAGRACVDALEVKVANEQDIRHIHSAIPRSITSYFEVSPANAFDLLPVLRTAGVRAKIRTGGVTPELFPSPSTVARFIAECARIGVPFKATAGLHHPVRCTKPLTYEPNAPVGVMHGFLNVFLAAAFALHGAGTSELTSLLEDQNPQHFQFDDPVVRWNGYSLETAQLQAARERFAISFGSCSFEEPISDLRDLRIL